MTATTREERDRLRELLAAATPGPWLVFDMDEGKPAEEKVNAEGWWWVWRKASLPYYGGVMRSESPAGDCNGKPDKCCRLVVGSAEITDGDEGVKEQADATLIAAAVNALPDLLDAADELEKVRAAINGLLSEWEVDGLGTDRFCAQELRAILATATPDAEGRADAEEAGAS